jgi:Xaa-Pro aminopeptidase
MPPSVSGETSAAKRERIAARLAENGAGLLIETLPDNIAWLLNVRGSDVPMNPVPHSFLLLDAAGAVEWFVDHRKLGNDRSGYELEGVALADPDDFYRRISDRSMGKLAMIDPQFTPVGVRMAVKQGGGRVIGRSSPLTLAKAMKSAAELEGYRQCHLEDGAALSDFLAWVMREGRARESSDNPLTELEAEAKLLAFRQERPGFLEASFRSISASAANAAMCHYNATPHTNTVIDSASPYLIDSGGQYLNGTTDVTRTIMLGEATAAVRRTYTAVLKGFLSLLMAQMPVGTKGHQLDAFARRPLWDLGLDYDHGTGHGVGHNMLVHEYPHRFSKVANPHGLVPGNIMTIEPGYYEAGEYGLRIENQVEVVAASPGFCRFESLTLAPIDLVAVDLSVLTTREILFLNAYHAKVRDALLPRVREDTRAFLMEQTRSASER